MSKDNNLIIYIDDVNKHYLSKITFLALFRSRSIGYRCAADLFCDAFRAYRDDIADETLRLIEVGNVSRHIINTYEITSIEDLKFLARHPKLIVGKIDSPSRNFRTKIFNFVDFDEANSEYKKAAYDYLNKMRPVKRAQQIDRIIEQFLILTNNNYYNEQASVRIMKNVASIADVDENGVISEEAQSILKTIVGAANM